MTNEKLDAILAEMRGERGFSVPFTPERGIWLSDFRSYADRIEAAVALEKIETATLAAGRAINLTDEKWQRESGNAAAMRAALARIVEWADRYVGRLCFHGPSPEMDGWRTASHAANDALALARVALSAPARNCDRFATHNEAKAAFLRSYFGPTEPEFVEDAFARWAFAPAERGAE